MADCYDGLGRAIEKFNLNSKNDFSKFVLCSMEHQIVQRFRPNDTRQLSFEKYCKGFRDYDSNPENYIIDIESRHKISADNVFDELLFKEEMVIRIMFRDDKVLSYEETAKLAGISVEEVKTIFNGVRQKLEDCNQQISEQYLKKAYSYTKKRS